MVWSNEIINYRYDAKGRLIDVARSGDINNGQTACYTYDQADNRSNLTVATSPCAASPTVSFSISDAGVTEGSTLTFTVTKSGTASTSHSVNYGTFAATATASVDYTGTSGTLTFAPAEVTKTFTVSTIDDSALEDAETLSATLSAPTGGAVVADLHGIGTIFANDGASLSFSVNDVSVTEGQNLVFTVSKSNPSTASSTVYYSIANGTAYAGSDFQYSDTSVALTFGPSQLTRTITIPTVENTTIEGSEVMYFNLAGVAGDSQGIGTIIDNDISTACTGVSFTVSSNGTVQEGSNTAFTVTKAGSTTGTCSVDYATVDGSATQPGDYVAKLGTLTFPSVTTQLGVIITTLDDSSSESSETFSLTLSNPAASATLGSPSSASATLTDDDGPTACAGVSFTMFSQGPVTEGTNSILQVDRSGPTTASCSVNYTTTNGTAVAPGDYATTSGTLKILAGNAVGLFIVPTVDDSTVESSETVTVTLSNPDKGGALGSATTVATINDNDGAPPSGFSVRDSGAVEGSPVTFVISRSPSTGIVKVNYATATGTAVSNDFTAKSGQVTFNNGESEKTVSVTTAINGPGEGTEFFYLNLSNPIGTTILDGQGVGSIENYVPPDPCPLCRTQSATTTGTPATVETEKGKAGDSDPDSGPGGAF